MTKEQAPNIPNAELTDFLLDFNIRVAAITDEDVAALKIKIKSPIMREILDSLRPDFKKRYVAIFNTSREVLEKIAAYYGKTKKNRVPSMHDLKTEIGSLALWTGDEKMTAIYELMGGKDEPAPDSLTA